MAVSKHEAAYGSEKEMSSGVFAGALISGALVMFIGVLALVFAFGTSLMTVLFLGSALLVGGIFQVVHGFKNRKSNLGVVQLLSGILGVVVGGLLLFRPVEGLMAVTFLIIGLLFADGLFMAISAIARRDEGWGWQAAFGAVTVLMGVILAASWPTPALWLLGTLVGVNLIMRGASLIAASVEFRRWTKRKNELRGTV